MVSYGFPSYLTHGCSLTSSLFQDPLWDDAFNPPCEELNKRLKEHMNKAGACLYAEVGRGQKGGAAFRTREEVPRMGWDGTARCWWRCLKGGRYQNIPKWSGKSFSLSPLKNGSREIFLESLGDHRMVCPTTLGGIIWYDYITTMKMSSLWSRWFKQTNQTCSYTNQRLGWSNYKHIASGT